MIRDLPVLTERRFADALLIMATLPFALVGGFWLTYLLGYNMSIASAVGFIALGGVASEIGVVMLVYVNRPRLGASFRLHIGCGLDYRAIRPG